MNEPKDDPWFPTQHKLANDERGVERDALLEKLEHCARTVKRRMDAGVTPSEFAQLEKLHRGLEAATEVVTALWRRYHPA